MLGELLKSEVDQLHLRLKEQNPLFTKAKDGSLTAREVGRYLTNVLYLIRHTPIYLTLARNVAARTGRSELATFYNEKLGEEQGHDQWAENDIRKVSAQAGGRTGEPLSASMCELVDYLRTTIEKDPALYLPYIFLAEYFTVVGTSEWLSDLEKKCSIPSEMMSVLGNHAELDKEHVLVDLEMITKVVSPEEYREPFLNVLSKSMGLFEEFCAEVAH